VTPGKPLADDRFDAWYAELTARHLERLTFQELRRAVQALSSLYVERRERIDSGTALHGAGKRAAQALFFGPLHLLLVRRIVAALGAASPPPRTIADLGCGTGAAGAAWALEAGGRPRLAATDRDAWAVTEAAWTQRSLGLRGQARAGRMEQVPPPDAPEPSSVLSRSTNSPTPRAPSCSSACSTRRAGARACSSSSPSRAAPRRGGTPGPLLSPPRAGARTTGALRPSCRRGCACSTARRGSITAS